MAQCKMTKVCSARVCSTRLAIPKGMEPNRVYHWDRHPHPNHGGWMVKHPTCPGVRRSKDYWWCKLPRHLHEPEHYATSHTGGNSLAYTQIGAIDSPERPEADTAREKHEDISEECFDELAGCTNCHVNARCDFNAKDLICRNCDVQQFQAPIPNSGVNPPAPRN